MPKRIELIDTRNTESQFWGQADTNMNIHSFVLDTWPDVVLRLLNVYRGFMGIELLTKVDMSNWNFTNDVRVVVAHLQQHYGCEEFILVRLVEDL